MGHKYIGHNYVRSIDEKCKYEHDARQHADILVIAAKHFSQYSLTSPELVTRASFLTLRERAHAHILILGGLQGLFLMVWR